MRVEVLGVGSDNYPELGNPSFIIYKDTGAFLINCGYTVFPYLKEKNLINSIDRVFLTSVKNECAGSLMAFLNYKKDVPFFILLNLFALNFWMDDKFLILHTTGPGILPHKRLT